MNAIENNNSSILSKAKAIQDYSDSTSLALACVMASLIGLIFFFGEITLLTFSMAILGPSFVVNTVRGLRMKHYMMAAFYGIGAFCAFGNIILAGFMS